MKRIIRFHFVPIEGEEDELDVFGLADIKDDDCLAQIEDAVVSYIDAVEAWKFADLVLDVLRSFDPNATLIEVPTICV